MTHKLEIGKDRPNGGRQFILDGKDIADEVTNFSITYDDVTRQIECEIVRILQISELTVEGVPVVTIGKPNPWSEIKDEDKF